MLPQRLVLAGLAVGLAAAPLSAQRDTSIVAGARYQRSGVHRFFFGADYRDLWTTPVRAPLLDLATFAGGLTPTTAGGGFQTKSLRFRGGDGFLYGFRSVDKDPAIVPPELEDTFVEDLIRDQTSSQHPGAPAVVAPLLEAAGVLHTEPALVVLPDDPALGEFRERFAGTLGFLERRAVVQPGVPPFAGARAIIGIDSLQARTRRGPDDLVDARAYLAARLMDVYLGDWDRHRGQWTWAQLGDGRPAVWTPIPEDRDQAFVRFDGLMLGMARATTAPQLVNFGGSYAGTVGQTWNGRDIDREFLTPLAGEVWDSVASALQARLTDEVIDGAVARLPAGWRAGDDARLAQVLRRRRDGLPREARRFFAVLSREAEWHATDADEDVALERREGGTLAVTLTRRGDAAPYAARVFRPSETRELRLYLFRGDDRVVLRGDGPASIRIRVVGGGSALIADSSRAGGIVLYGGEGDRTEGIRTIPVSTEAYEPPGRRSGRPQRDWGRWTVPVSWVALGPDLGFFVGSGFVTTRYSFRHTPYANQWRLRAGYSTGGETFRVAVDGTIYREASSVHATIELLASGMEVLNWHGTGNHTSAAGPAEYFRVQQNLFRFAPTLVAPIGARTRLAIGPVIALSATEDLAGRIVRDSQPYGDGDFAYVGLRGEFAYDARDIAGAATRGVTLKVGGSWQPAALDAVDTWGDVHGEATAYLTARGMPLRPTLALRAGGRSVHGSYPYFASAFIGDAATVRLGRKNRYGGDAAAWGSAELRMRLGRHGIVIPGDIGFFALGDAGRVFVQGERSDTWHGVSGGGLWFSFARPGNLLTVAMASGRERTALYMSAGFSY